jgi:hypothetical protein
MAIGWGYFDADPGDAARPQLVHHSNQDVQQRLKNALRDAGIPYRTEMRDGQEFITWPPAHNTAARAVIERFDGKPLGNNQRNAQFPDPALQKQFTDWLAKQGIKHEVVTSYGMELVVWDESAGDLVRQYMESRSADCKARVAAGKTDATRC